MKPRSSPFARDTENQTHHLGSLKLYRLSLAPFQHTVLVCDDAIISNRRGNAVDGMAVCCECDSLSADAKLLKLVDFRGGCWSLPA
jgi:hypothetical protein